MFGFVDSSGEYMGIYYLIYVPFISTFLFHSKSKKIVSNCICSVAIRDHKCKLACIYKDSTEPPPPFSLHTQSKGWFRPCWLDFKKRKKKKKKKKVNWRECPVYIWVGNFQTPLEQLWNDLFIGDMKS